MTKRIFSLFLAMLLLVTSVPMQGFAAEAETIVEATEDVMEMTSSGDDYMFLEDLTMSFGAVPGATEETAAETTEATVETTEAAVEKAAVIRRVEEVCRVDVREADDYEQDQSGNQKSRRHVLEQCDDAVSPDGKQEEK